MTTLALNMIVGSNEAQLLKRCLTTFDAKNIFDEIIIINTSNDEQIDNVALEFGSKVYNFIWKTKDFPYGNFGGAREEARKNTKSEKIMWLDADDILLKQHKEKFIEAISIVKDDKYKDIIIWKMPYSLVYDQHGNPEQYFMRERIIDREKIQWKRAVHEIVFPYFDMVKNATMRGVFITHAPVKPSYSSASRNISILEHEYSKDSSDVQTRYFLGRDYILGGNQQKGIDLLEEILCELSTSSEMLYAIAIELAWYYSYYSSHPRPKLREYNVDNILKVESYCRIALSLSFSYAEPYVILGDTYFYKKDYESASKMYLVALKKPLDDGMLKSTTLYGEIPCERLAFTYEARGLLGMALHYNKQAIRHNPKNEEYVEIRKLILGKLNNEMNLLCQA